MTTEYLTELIITQQQQSTNTLLFLSSNFRNLNVIHQSNIEYNIHSYRGNSLVIQMKNYNRGEILNLKAELNSNGYNVSMMTLTSSNYLYINIIDNQCLTLQHDLNSIDDTRLVNCVNMAEYFNFTTIHSQLQTINNDRYAMDTTEDELSSMFCGMDIDC